MKWQLLTLVALLLLSPVAAHGDHAGFLPAGSYIDHGKEAGANLAPGESQNYTIAFNGAHLWAGWFYVFYGSSSSETTWTLINHNSTDHGEVAGQWTWNGTQREIGQFPSDGVYELIVENHGPATASIRWSYDQTCDCTFKPMPFNGSYAWFNPYMEKGEKLTFVPGAIVVNQTDPSTTDAPVSFTATHATWSGYGTTWDTFNIHGTFDATENITLHARETGIQYVLLHMETKNDARGLLLYGVEEEKETPTWGMVPIAGALLAAAMVRREE